MSSTETEVAEVALAEARAVIARAMGASPAEPVVFKRVLFLDIDGVLNSARSCVALGGFPSPGRHKFRDWDKFDAVAIGLLRRVVRITGAACVLSSSWRLGMDDAELLELSAFLGVPIIGRTRAARGTEVRGEQIRDWIDAHPEVASYVILDDDSDMLEPQRERFVKVDHQDGFSYAQYQQVVRLFGCRP